MSKPALHVKRVAKENPIGLAGTAIGSFCFLLWLLIGSTPSNAMRVTYIGFYLLILAVYTASWRINSLVRKSLPDEKADEEPPKIAINLFVLSYLSALTFIIMLAVDRIGEEAVRPQFVVVAAFSYATGLYSGYRLMCHQERRLQKHVDGLDQIYQHKDPDGPYTRF